MKSFIAIFLTFAIAASAFDSPFGENYHRTTHCSGTVRYPSGEMAAGVHITFYPGSYSSDDDYNYHEAITDKNGRYEIIPPKKVSGFVWGV